MSRRERDKGTRGELEVRDVFRAFGFDCDRTPNSGGLRIPGDLIGTVPVHVEVKRQERLQLWQWIEQAEQEAAGAVAVVAFRRSRSRWRADLDLERFAELLAASDGRAAHV
jgi:Holliday junction resolvase